jgi:hypothetical protein
LRLSSRTETDESGPRQASAASAAAPAASAAAPIERSLCELAACRSSGALLASGAEITPSDETSCCANDLSPPPPPAFAPAVSRGGAGVAPVLGARRAAVGRAGSRGSGSIVPLASAASSAQLSSARVVAMRRSQSTLSLVGSDFTFPLNPFHFLKDERTSPPPHTLPAHRAPETAAHERRDLHRIKAARRGASATVVGRPCACRRWAPRG